MELVLDGIIYEQQRVGGISRTYNELLPRLHELDPSLQTTIVTCAPLRQDLPTHPAITHRALPSPLRFMRPSRLWWPVIPAARSRALRRLRPRNQTWLSTHYTRPPKWPGPEVELVVDMIPELFVDSFHGPQHDQFRRHKRDCLEAADALICISHSTCGDLLNTYKIDPRRVHVVHLSHGSNFFPLAQDVRRPSGPMYFLYVGDRAHYKNFDWMLTAYASWQMRDDVELVVVGRGWSRAERSRMTDLGIANHVHLMKEIDDAQLRQLYCGAAALVLPSRYEGFGIPLLEALACGCPVVASHIPSSIEVAGECPFYFELERPESLHAAFDAALSKGRDQAVVDRGLSVAAQFSWNRTASDVLRIISEVQ